jgi:hypothetical protein
VRNWGWLPASRLFLTTIPGLSKRQRVESPARNEPRRAADGRSGRDTSSSLALEGAVRAFQSCQSAGERVNFLRDGVGHGAGDRRLAALRAGEIVREVLDACHACRQRIVA